MSESNDAEIVDAEVVEEEASSRFSIGQIITRIKDLPTPALAVVVIMLIGSTGGAVLYADDVIEWVRGEPDYQLIDFNASEARNFAQTLVDICLLYTSDAADE